MASRILRQSLRSSSSRPRPAGGLLLLVVLRKGGELLGLMGQAVIFVHWDTSFPCIVRGIIPTFRGNCNHL